MKDLSGKTAVVTGGASGLGMGLCIALAREGMNVVVSDIEQEPAEAIADQIRAEGGKAIAVRTDVSDLASVQALAAAAEQAFGSVQLLCNNAGVFMVRQGRDATHDDWRWILGVNLWGPIHGVEAFLPGMLAQETECHICSTSSLAGTLPSNNSVIYSTSKYGLVGMSETLASELAGTNVTVSVVLPAGMQTRILDAGRNRPAELGDTNAPRPSAPTGPANTGSTFGRSLEPLEAASVVIHGIRNGQLHIFTDMGIKPLLQARHDRMIAEFDQLAAWDASRGKV